MNAGFDIVIVGAGPAGLAAATAAAKAGRRVALLDDNPRVGGQIWRAGQDTSAPDRARSQAVAMFEASGATWIPQCQVVDSSGRNGLQVWFGAQQRIETFAFERLVIATGARERFLPFPGWTLPGVFGAGGLQALVRGGYDVRGKRIVVAGTGPLLLAVAAHLKAAGAEIVAIAEQAPMRQLAGFGTTLMVRPGKIAQGLRLRAELAGVPYRTSCWPVEVQGREQIESVQLTDGTRVWTESCDLLACGFHLVPNTELAALLGCKISGTGVEVDANQQTSIEGVYCAGEPTGIAGLDAAIVQGEIAGLAAAGCAEAASRLHKRRDAEASFGRALSRAFALRKELHTLATPDTVVCRCEDVKFGDLQAQAAPHGNWTNAKLQTRCGMGACQGRICGPALETLFGWRNASVRPPLFPIPVAAMCSSPPAQDQVTLTIPQEICQ